MKSISQLKLKEALQLQCQSLASEENYKVILAVAQETFKRERGFYDTADRNSIEWKIIPHQEVYIDPIIVSRIILYHLFAKNAKISAFFSI